jgi:hypothetical protein
MTISAKLGLWQSIGKFVGNLTRSVMHMYGPLCRRVARGGTRGHVPPSPKKCPPPPSHLPN